MKTNQFEEVIELLKRLTAAHEDLGFNRAGGVPGTTEYIGMQLKDLSESVNSGCNAIAEAIESLAESISEVSGK